MKKCVKCNTKYTDDVKKCSICGEELVKIDPNEKKESKKVVDILRYVFGGLIILINIIRISDIKIVAVLGFLLGTSMMPITYKLLEKICKNKKLTNILEFVIPIVLGIIWLVIIPGEQLKEINILNEHKTIGVNENYQIQFTTNLSNNDKAVFKYESSNEEIAKVDQNGIITGISDGTVTITISGDNEIKSSQDFKVEFIEIKEAEITGNLRIEVGKTGSLKVNTTPKFVSDTIISWTSSDPNIIQVDNSGNITAVSQGSAKIIVQTEKGKSIETDVKAYVEVEELKISNESLRIEKTKTGKLNVELVPSNADNDSLVWSSTNEKVAKVDQSGNITATGEGTAKITVKSSNGKTASSDIEVFEVKPESIKLNKTSLSLSVGNSASVTATISPSNTSDKSVTWLSSKPSVATVENGKITAVGRGTATITAYSSNSKKAEVKVNVTQKAPITIKNFRWNMDYVCGVEWNFSITNNTNKQINYVTLKWYNYNAVGDPVYDSIDGKNYVGLRYTGPLKPGANSGSKRNTTKFYNCNYKSSTMSEIGIEYADGTKEIIKNSEFSTYTNLIN